MISSVFRQSSLLLEKLFSGQLQRIGARRKLKRQPRHRFLLEPCLFRSSARLPQAGADSLRSGPVTNCGGCESPAPATRDNLTSGATFRENGEARVAILFKGELSLHFAVVKDPQAFLPMRRAAHTLNQGSGPAASRVARVGTRF